MSLTLEIVDSLGSPLRIGDRVSYTGYRASGRTKGVILGWTLGKLRIAPHNSQVTVLVEPERTIKDHSEGVALNGTLKYQQPR